MTTLDVLVKNMCHFITMILPPSTDWERCSERFKKWKRKPERINNQHIEKVMSPGEIYIYPSGKRCDCGTAIGSMLKKEPDARVEKKSLDQLRKNGWSESKIQRWVSEKKNIEEREKRIQDLREQNIDWSDPDGWRSIIYELLNEEYLPYVGIIYHWYSASLDNEKFGKIGRIEKKMTKNIGELLYRLKEDMLLIVKNNQNQSVFTTP